MHPVLHFPSLNSIVDYLGKHPLTSDPYLKEKDILATVARAFADCDKAPIGIQMGVMLAMYDLNEKIGLPKPAMMTISINLTQALQDCAEGKVIKLEKR